MMLEELLARSRAKVAFKRDVRRFLATGVAERLAVIRPTPPVKTLRLVAHLLEQAPELPIESLEVDARSGCSDFSGVATVRSSDALRRFEFTWDCRWRAEQEGWLDVLGFPDQIRAAREFDWRCFAVWRELPG